MPKIAEIIIDNPNNALNKEFDYIVPDELISKIQLGQIVVVPFGKGNRKIEGYVVGLKEKSEFNVLKEIEEISSKIPMIDENNILLAKWMSKHYLCNFSDCLKLMLPSKIDDLNQTEGKYARLLISNEEAIDIIDNKKLRGSKQLQVLNHLFLNKSNLVRDVLRNCLTTLDTLKSLEKKGIVEIYEDSIDKDPLKDKNYQKTTEFVPNRYQKEVIQQIENQTMGKNFLIHGVTGSGKTEVYLQLIKSMLEKGKQAIVLVPEISLTPQMIERFVGRFGNQVAVLHSKLSDGQKKDQWYKIKEGKVNVVVGARSAIFAPFERLGIIIVDEEHENTYKSEQTPKYNAIEVANKRGELENAVVVLGSATPSIEDYYKANMDKLRLLEIPIRANENSTLPEVEIVDMKEELQEGNKSIFSRRLYEEIEKNIKVGNQTILFLNKRGYSGFVLCRQCGYVAKCEKCNISLTYHAVNDRMVCHYCGYNSPKLEICPECKSKYIRHFGVGTQRLEEEVRKAFPSASVLRMDMDTTSTKDSHENILNAFKNNNINILIGTQMIAKGHDFPNVTLVGVISADMMLNLDDFRATEKTFQLLTQVEGRAGRAEKKGIVIVQTYDTEHFSIVTAKEQDYKKFYDIEIDLRKKLLYPPFKDILLINFSSYSYNYTKDVAFETFNIIKKEFENNSGIYVSSPTVSPLSKINNKYRWRIILKCDLNDEIREILFKLIEKQKDILSEKCTINIDINPMSMI